MNPTTAESLKLSNDELVILAELLEAERGRLLVGVRHAFHRSYRDELHRRLKLLEILMERMATPVSIEKDSGGA